MPLLPDGEGNWDAVRVIEVGDPGLRRKETGLHIHIVSAFLPNSNRHRAHARGCSSDACCQQAPRSRGRPAGLARPRPGCPRVGRTRTWSLSPRFQLAPLKLSHPKQNPQGREPALKQIFPPRPDSSFRVSLSRQQPARGIELNASWRLLSLANCSNNGHY